METQVSAGRRLRWWLVVVVAFAGTAVAWAAGARSDGVVDPGQHSAFTRAELRGNWAQAERFPLLVPVVMPAGAGGVDEPGFGLDNVVVDPGAPARRRVWVSYYGSDAFGAEGEGFRVFQRPWPARGASPCGPSAKVPRLSRHIGNASVTVCSPALRTDPAARRYWAGVELTGDLEAVDWLQG